MAEQDPFPCEAELEMVGVGTSSHRRIAVPAAPGDWADRVRQRAAESARALAWTVLVAGDGFTIVDLDGRRLGAFTVRTTAAGIAIAVRPAAAMRARWLPLAGAGIGSVAAAMPLVAGAVGIPVGLAILAGGSVLGGLGGLVLAGLAVSAPSGAGERAFATWARGLPKLVESTA